MASQKSGTAAHPPVSGPDPGSSADGYPITAILGLDLTVIPLWSALYRSDLPPWHLNKAVFLVILAMQMTNELLIVLAFRLIS
jgi:hypothetical protein